MNARRINANRPHLWKADIAASVDQFNQWFMGFAPEAFRSTQSQTDAGYLQALRTAYLFLAASARRDPDAGLALMSQAVRKEANEGPADTDSELRLYMSGLSNSSSAWGNSSDMPAATQSRS